MEKYQAQLEPDYTYDNFKIRVSYTSLLNLLNDVSNALRPLKIISLNDHTDDPEKNFDYSLETQSGTLTLANSTGIFDQKDTLYLRIAYPNTLSIFSLKRLFNENSKFDVLEDKKHPAFERMQPLGWACLCVASILLLLIARYGKPDLQTEIRGIPLAILALVGSVVLIIKFGIIKFVISRIGTKFPDPINLNAMAFCLMIVLGLVTLLFLS